MKVMGSLLVGGNAEPFESASANELNTPAAGQLPHQHVSPVVLPLYTSTAEHQVRERTNCLSPLWE